jgi:penicillin-binding protein 1A
MTDPQDVQSETPPGAEGAATLTDEDIETRRFQSGSFASVDDSDTGDDTGDTGDDSGDPTDTADTGNDTGDTSDTGDDSGDAGA